MIFSTKALKNKIKELLDLQSLAILATNNGESPHTYLVGYNTSGDLKHIYFATFRETQKYGSIRKIPHVSLRIDSRTNNTGNFKNDEAITVLGTVSDAGEEEKNLAFEQYVEKYPDLKIFLKDPHCVFLKVNVEKYIYLKRCQKIQEYTMPKAC